MPAEAPAVRADHLGKCYQMYRRPQDRLRQMIMPRLHRALGREPRAYFKPFWALRNVSFRIAPGEAVGIVGRNGSGKSTLLQLICGILTPTTGGCSARGSVAALLELGTGFNPQFTGLENILLYGGILGMPDHRVRALLPEILRFADIGEFIHRPVKTYSSGMLVRLAFAVSVSREPDILVVDEALAVGDEAFRRKCFSRIERLREKGTTLLFVSHAAGLVVSLCDRAFMLENGRLVADGRPKDVTDFYEKRLFSAAAAPPPKNRGDKAPAPKKGPADGTTDPPRPGRAYFADQLVSKSRFDYEGQGVRIEDPHIETPEGQRVNMLVMRDRYHYCYHVRFTRPAWQVQCGMLIRTVAGLALGGAAYPSALKTMATVPGGARFAVTIAFRCLLAPGSYFINAGVRGMPDPQADPLYLHRIIDAVMFKVMPDEDRAATGMVDLDVRPSSVRLSPVEG
jgi:lipopolysaccharide transport system ATP-binding protein